MIKRNNPRRVIADINIVPYVDVMLVLLVIFMITAPLITQGVEVELPQATAKALSQDTPLPVILSVNKKGQLFLNVAATPNQPITEYIIQAEVAAALKISPKRQVLVRADKQVSYDLVLQAMVLLQSAGVDTIGLQTNQPNEVEKNG